MTDTTNAEEDRTRAAVASAISLTSRRTNPNFQRILESKWFLNSEDKGQYEQDLEALVEELNPQSFLAWKDIEDYADKLQDERRYKPVIAAVINAKLARRKHLTVDPEREKREAKAVEEYLPSVIKLTRLLDNSFQTRKRLEKDFRGRAGAPRKGAAPSAPETRIEE